MTAIKSHLLSYALDAKHIFEREIGAPISEVVVEQVGPEEFLAFDVGREAQIYQHALVVTQHGLASDNPFKGKLKLRIRQAKNFPGSLEANCLLTLLTRSTRTITESRADTTFAVPYVPFQNREDHVLSQPASHVVLGRRGVGKSTLIVRATDLLARSGAISIVLDMQAYVDVRGDEAIREVTHDIALRLEEAIVKGRPELNSFLGQLEALKTSLAAQSEVRSAAPQLKRILRAITSKTRSNVYVFLDDFHVLDNLIQPELLHFLNGALKGASGWLKVAGVRSLINYYASNAKRGLQVPGDAQEISLDLTLENPEAAERHLRAILESFLRAVGYSLSERVLPEAAFKRLVWANAGVPRDFLQMFARALEHSQRNGHATVTVSDVNIAIGEFGQKKFQEMRDDARQDVENIEVMIRALDRFCLDIEKVNAFLLKSEDSEERILVRKLSDLRLVHLIHQSITPDSAGEKYEAFIVDYALFTGFRRRPNVREMIPSESQFKASELRKLPKVEKGFLEQYSQDEFSSRAGKRAAIAQTKAKKKADAPAGPRQKRATKKTKK